MQIITSSPILNSENHQQVVCHECHFTVQLPTLSHRQSALCPRCGFNLTTYYNNASQKIIALSMCALIFLLTSLLFEFLSFNASGQAHSINILGSLLILNTQGYGLLTVVTALFVLILPATILFSLLYILVPIQFGHRPKYAVPMFNLTFILLPWLMAEIFLIGVLVSLIKIMSMADIGLGLSFYSYVLFILFLIATLMFVDKHQLTQLLKHTPPEQTQSLSPSVRIQSTWALLLTATLLYIPANVLPIMHTNILGNTEPSTILGGIVLFWKMGSYPIAIIIFVASIVVPVAKLLILCWLNYSIQKQHKENLRQRMFWYRVTEIIGKWSMIDVFVVIILVSLIQLGNIMSIVPGHAAIAFCAVVIFTMWAAISFDTRLIWHQTKKTTEIETEKHND